MPKHLGQRDPKKSRLLMLLMVPSFAILTFPVSAIVARSLFPTSVMFAHSSEFATAWSFAWRMSVSAYAIPLTLSLLYEDEWAQAAEDFRPLEIVIGLAGLGIGIFVLLGALRSSSWPDSRLGSFVGIASAAILYLRRTDRIRALAFGAMAIATFHLPLVFRQPPFLTASDIFAALAIRFLVRVKRGRAARRPVLVPVLACTVCTVTGVYGLSMAYQMRSVLGLLIFSATILFFGGGVVLILVRGPWPRD